MRGTDVQALAQLQLATDIRRMNDDSVGLLLPIIPILSAGSASGGCAQSPPEHAGLFLVMLFDEAVIQRWRRPLRRTGGGCPSCIGPSSGSGCSGDLCHPATRPGPSRRSHPRSRAPSLSTPTRRFLHRPPWVPAPASGRPMRRKTGSIRLVPSQRTSRRSAHRLSGVQRAPTPTPVKQRRTPTFSWFIRYQVLNESYGSIASHERHSKRSERCGPGFAACPI